MRAVFAFALAACSIASVGKVLFTWMLAGRVVPAEGVAHLMAYALCFIVSVLVVGITGTTRLDAWEVLRAHPLILGIALVTQVVIAAWASREGPIAIVALVTAICASACLFCCAGPTRGLDAGFLKQAIYVGEGTVPEPARASHIASIVLGMSFGVALLSSLHELMELAACLPSIALIACAGYAWYRMDRPPALQLLLRSVLTLGAMGIAAAAVHSSVAGSLVGVALMFTQAPHALRAHAGLSAYVRPWARTCASLVCLGALLGVLLIAVFARPFTDTPDLYSVFLWEFTGGGVALLIALWGVYAIWQMCQSLLDRASLESREGCTSPADAQRMRAVLTLHGMSEFECEVILRSIEGASIQEIACDLHYSASSVKAARAKAYRMLGVHDARALRDALSQAIGV